MDTHRGAVFSQRSRPASVSGVLVMTFILGLAAGLSLARVVPGPITAYPSKPRGRCPSPAST